MSTEEPLTEREARILGENSVPLHSDLDDPARPAPSGDADAAWEALLDDMTRSKRRHLGNWAAIIARHRPLIEALRAVAPSDGAGGLDVERLARAMEDVFPGWLDEAPGTAEAQAEMRSYAEQLDAAYRFLYDSAAAYATDTTP